MTKRRDRDEHERAMRMLETGEHLCRLTCDDSDTRIAHVAAEYLLAQNGPPYRLSIRHDTRTCAVRQVQSFLKRGHKGERGIDLVIWRRRELHSGDCLLDYDWKYKNSVGIKTDDRDRARDWLLWAFALGYGPFFSTDGRHGIAFGQGSVADIRERIRKREGRFSPVNAEHLAAIRASLQ